MATTPYFEYVRRSPRGALGQVVRESWSMRAQRCRTAVESALPDGGVEIYFNLGPAGRHLGDRQHSTPRTPRAAWVLGPRDHRLLIEKEIRDSDVIGIRLQPGTALSVLGVPASELRAGMVDLDVFWRREVDDVRDRLATAADPNARLAIVESAVAQRLAHTRVSSDVSAARALCDMMGASVDESIKAIATRAGLSHRRLIALFDEMVGLKPKAFQRVQRLRQVLQLVAVSPRPSWTVIAHRSGYFDQAHLINDFRALTGVSPTEYARDKSSVGEGFVPYRLAGEVGHTEGAGLQMGSESKNIIRTRKPAKTPNRGRRSGRGARAG